MRLLEERMHLADDFAEPVPEFQHSRGAPLVCFVNDRRGVTHHVAHGYRGKLAGTDLRRLNLSALTPLETGVRLADIAESVAPRFRGRVVERVRNGGLLTPRQFQALVEAATHAGGRLAELLIRYSAERAQRIKALSSAAKRELGYQQQAVATALALTDIDRRTLQAWDPPASGPPRSFLEGLPQVRLREDLMVLNDFINIPGYEFLRNFVQGAAQFRNEEGTTLSVAIANRLRLEELTGADLIYCNERFKAFVMVQYKAMERSGKDAVFRLPDSQLQIEISRMDNVIERLREVEEELDHSGFRLSSNPFFLKFCPRIVFNPDDVSLMPGMYISLDHWKLLASGDALTRQHGKKALTFKNVGRHLDNTAFMMLVSDGWIGTSPARSQLLEQAIRMTVESGRAAVIAVRTQAA